MKNRTRFAQFTLIFLVMPLLAGCNRNAGDQQTKGKSVPPAAIDAVKSLRKIEAATQVSVSYLQYSQLVIDAKAQVNEASSVLPDGELKSEINAAMDAYADAGLPWHEQIQGSSILYKDLEPGKTLIPKYSLSGQGLDVLRARTLILEAATKHLDRASKLIQQ